MSATKFNVETELRKLAKGKKTRVSAQTLAICLLPEVAAAKPKAGDEVQFLDRLFRLEDPRA